MIIKLLIGNKIFLTKHGVIFTWCCVKRKRLCKFLLVLVRYFITFKYTPHYLLKSLFG